MSDDDNSEVRNDSLISDGDDSEDKSHIADNNVSEDTNNLQIAVNNGSKDTNNSQISGDDGSKDKSQPADNYGRKNTKKSKILDDNGRYGKFDYDDSGAGDCPVKAGKAYLRKDLRAKEVLRIPSGWLVSSVGIDFQIEQYPMGVRISLKN
mmetsp:Transcript_13638/g.21046  ORF Transcript_13638/g.21046 Transcript_13638/m.21046 type:complete len:151 (+) Transcript_13638:829-1281(+)